jgi:hypothetical protein
MIYCSPAEFNKRINRYENARVAELVDALDLGSSSGDRVGVQLSPLAPVKNQGDLLKSQFLSFLTKAKSKTPHLGKKGRFAKAASQRA